MGFIEAIKTCFRKYFVFKGRAQRSEYWWWTLFTLLALTILGIIDSILFPFSGADSADILTGSAYQNTPISNVFSFFTIVPSIAVAARRLHDIDKSGWWQLLPYGALGIFSAAGLMPGAIGSSAGIVLVVLGLTTLVTFVLFFVWLATDSHKGDNRFGSSPKYGGQAQAFD